MKKAPLIGNKIRYKNLSVDFFAPNHWSAPSIFFPLFIHRTHTPSPLNASWISLWKLDREKINKWNDCPQQRPLDVGWHDFALLFDRNWCLERIKKKKERNKGWREGGKKKEGRKEGEKEKGQNHKERSSQGHLYNLRVPVQDENVEPWSLI